MVIFGIAFQAAGVLLIDHVYENALEQEKKYALQEFQYNKYILQSILYSGQDFLWTQEGDLEILDSFTAPVALYDQEKNCIYSNLSMTPNVSDLRESGEGRLAFRIYQKEGESYIYVYDHVRQGESGTVVMESPVLAWQDPAAEDTAAGEGDETGKTKKDAERILTVEQMEQVIKYRNHCEGEILHEPAVGQITMEEAIASGENWLVEMDFWKRQNLELLSRRASLGIKADLSMLEVPMESWYSFWTVRFSNEYLYADLSINAVTGKVWDAEISLYGNMAHRQSFDKLELFVRLAGVQGEVEKFAQTNQSGSLVYIAVKGSQLYAEQGYYTANTTRINEFIEDGRSTIVELHDQRVIEYRLRVEEKDS